MERGVSEMTVSPTADLVRRDDPDPARADRRFVHRSRRHAVQPVWVR